MSERYRVGVDIGGTFTDIVLLGADGTLHTKKISSSVGNYAQAIVEGLSELFAETGLAGGVIVDTAAWRVDEAATRKLRAEIAAARGWRDVPKVQWREPAALSQAAE